jgi:hypothetical protein
MRRPGASARIKRPFIATHAEAGTRVQENRVGVEPKWPVLRYRHVHAGIA